MSGNKLVLVDGMGVLYRAFFAIRNLSTRSGRPTNAVFGFIRMLRQMEKIWSPTHWAVAFDGGLPAERIELFEEYKAQRSPMPDSLREQIPTVEEYLDRSQIIWVRQEGQEADDVLASLAAWARDFADEILIASTDKDMYQIVSKNVKLIGVSGKGTGMGPEDVASKTGVAPSQIVDWLSLTGDSSDNIPGVPGVGPKTAARLLSDYYSLDCLWEQLDKVKGEKLRKTLKENKETVVRNRKMVRLRKDLDCMLCWDELKVRSIDPNALLPFLEELEFDYMAGDIRGKSSLPK